LGPIFLSSYAEAFIFIRGGAYAKGERPVSHALMWANRTVTFHVNTDQTVYGGSIVPELTTAQFQAALSSAIARWNGICASDIQVVLGGTTNNTSASGDSVNTVVWDNRTTGELNQIGNTGTLAVAYSSVNNSTNTTVDCDIVVNGEATGNFGVDGEANAYDLVGILVHEIGHCLGLDHSIEPPTFTSSNPILLTAPMKSTVAAGDLSARTLSQDEIDGMECVNSSSYAARSGYYCTSYHGTSGNGALSGTVGGGPSSSRICGDGQSSTVATSKESGGGCVSKAIAADGGAPEPYAPGWEIFVGAVLFLRFAYRHWRRLLAFSPLLLFPGSPAAEAAIEVSYQYARAEPALVNNASAFTSAEGSFTTTKAEPSEKFRKFSDLFFALTKSGGSNASLGLYYKTSMGEEVELKGYNSANTLLMTKTSKLDSWLVGLVGKVFVHPESARIFNLFLELQVGAGKTKYKQSILDSANALSTLEASAFAVETIALVGAKTPLYGNLDFLLKAGYGRMQSNYYSVDAKAGARFADVEEGKRLTLRSGEEIRLVKKGLVAQAGVALVF
jgi:hypothetical protein